MRQSVAPSAAGRQSVAVGRQSHAQGLAGAGASISSAAIQRKVLQKKRELEGVAALERASDLFLRRMIALAEDTESMADAGQAIGQVLEQWPRMFRILALVVESHEQATAQQSTGVDEELYESRPVGERLVRVPIEELEEQSREQQTHQA